MLWEFKQFLFSGLAGTWKICRVCRKAVKAMNHTIEAELCCFVVKKSLLTQR